MNKIWDLDLQLPEGSTELISAPLIYININAATSLNTKQKYYQYFAIKERVLLVYNISQQILSD